MPGQGRFFFVKWLSLSREKESRRQSGDGDGSTFHIENFCSVGMYSHKSTYLLLGKIPGEQWPSNDFGAEKAQGRWSSVGKIHGFIRCQKHSNEQIKFVVCARRSKSEMGWNWESMFFGTLFKLVRNAWPPQLRRKKLFKPWLGQKMFKHLINLVTSCFDLRKNF